MKKLFVLAVCSLTSVGAFASSTKEDENIMMAVTIICSILGVILFFKMLGMTNNVSAIKHAYLDGAPMENDKEFADFIRKIYC